MTVLLIRLVNPKAFKKRHSQCVRGIVRQSEQCRSGEGADSGRGERPATVERFTQDRVRHYFGCMTSGEGDVEMSA